MIDTLVIAKIDLQQFNKDFPHIMLYTLYAKSENAGCYHSSSTIEVLIHLCNQLNIKIKRYDFSEPQHGKDACDREAAYNKRMYL